MAPRIAVLLTIALALAAACSATRGTEADRLERAVSIALAETAEIRATRGEFRVVGAKQLILEGKYVWRITMKPVRLLPEDPSTELITLGGEIFVNVDLETGKAVVRYGE